MIGCIFGRLRVIEKSERARYWRCRCECGNEAEVRGDHLRSGRTLSCGCAQREATAYRNADRTKHGHATNGRSPTYRSWRAMRTRCLNPNSDGYADYGARGIAVCERWGSFDAFLEDMGERPPGTTIERMKNEVGYEPGNCRWATASEQENNKRHNVRIAHEGQNLTVAEWSSITGIGYQTLRKRIEAGWPGSRVLTEPIRRR